ncbi:hypothetical protein M408DRAFT_68296 [Serendipita vermifera MAFF 305830]|uniref:F-box domain-containing protein n=1 Tax=Serendipita vermifera MAFF 305830 TaxID=933852 RepID=A0A0C3AXE4_SERVB|nr:hypothetical protein M408DRAFT_68296 [Serendipita vermifera MAFF 305830]
MHSSPNRISKKSKNQKATSQNARISAQHESAISKSSNSQLTDAIVREARRSVLERFPYETLTHITSYLQPPALASLSAVSSWFKEYLSDDVVWKLALFANILGIHPEHQKHSSRAFLLRRTESTWKLEYIVRFQSITRWNQSRTSFTAHHPLRIPVPNLHLLSDGESLLAAPEHFSWVFKTVPSTGKIYKGQYQPTLLNQAHPLNDWSPPTAGAIASENNIVKIIWASQSGDVMVKTAQMHNDSKPLRRAPAVVSSVEDRHTGLINSISWATTVPKHAKSRMPDYFITAAEDGRVKIWNTSCVAVWTSPPSPDGKSFIRAEFDLSVNIAVAVSEKGTIVTWIHPPVEDTLGEMSTLIANIPLEDSNRRLSKSTLKLLFDPGSSIIVHVQEEAHAYRFDYNLIDMQMECSIIAGPLGPITAMELSTSKGPTNDSPILMIGDSLSHLSIYDLSKGTTPLADTPSQTRPDEPVEVAMQKIMTPNFSISTHEYGAITSIATNGLVFAVGNEMGIITVWDAVTLSSVRTIDASSLVKNGIGVITLLCQKEQLIASVGNAVVHWRTGNLSSRFKKLGKGTKVPSSRGKFLDEYQRAILESQAELELTSKRVPPVVFSEQEQMAALRALGLDESSAVEYALMVSHDEAAYQGLFEVEDSVSVPQSPTGTATSINTDLTASTTPSAPASASTHEDVHNMPSSPWKSRSMSKLSPPNPRAIGKVQLSPPYRAEAMGVGVEKRSSIGSMKTGSESEKEELFPRISPPNTNKGSHSSTPLVSGVSTSATNPRATPSKGPVLSTKWSSIVKSSTLSPSFSGGASPGGKGGTSSRSWHSSHVSGTTSTPIQDEDAQLQFALELSLAEALSRQG